MNFDITKVKETYANMYDDELLQFAINEGLQLSSDAFLLLREELKKRNIGADIVNKLEHEIIFQTSIQKRKFTEEFNRNLFKDALEYAFSQKENGKNNYEIYTGLIEMGINEEHSNYIVNRIDQWVEDLRQDSKIEVQAGVGLFILGVIAMYATIQLGHFQIAAAMLILLGIIRVFVFQLKRNKYNRILKNIQMEGIDSI